MKVHYFYNPIYLWCGRKRSYAHAEVSGRRWMHVTCKQCLKVKAKQ